MLYSSYVPKPRFTRYLVERKILKDNPLTVVDVGARGGLEYHWANYEHAARFICFEPNKEECGKLNAELGPKSNSTFYPVALYKDKGTHTFYEQVSPAACGLYYRDSKIVDRFPVGKLVKVTGTSSIQTTDFDSFVEEYKIPDIDFIKTDAEGADFDIIQGSLRSLKKSVLGMSCEMHFQPWCVGAKGLFSELDQLVRPLGFRLYDINMFRFANNAFPSIDSVLPGGCGTADYGQIIFGQAIFFRDPVAEIEHGKLLELEWDETRILKAVSLFEVFGLPDCAIELLDTAEKHNLLKHFNKGEIEKFRDLITSGFLGKTIIYRQHLQKLADIKKRGYASYFEHIKPRLKKIPFLPQIRSFIKKQIAQRRNNFGAR